MHKVIDPYYIFDNPRVALYGYKQIFDDLEGISTVFTNILFLY